MRDVEPGEIVVLEPGRGAALRPLCRGEPGAVRLRAHLLRPPGLVHGGAEPLPGAAADGHGAGGRASGRRGPGDARAGHRRSGRGGVRGGLRHPLPRGHGPQPVHRPDVHPAVAGDAPARGLGEAVPPSRGRPRAAAGGGRRLDRARHDDPADRGSLRKAGAREIHVRISAPPIYHPCFYGIDTQVETELIASTHSLEEIRRFIDADSLGYLSIRGVLSALDLPYEQFCFACFDGRYPEPVPYDAGERKFMLEMAGTR